VRRVKPIRVLLMGAVSASLIVGSGRLDTRAETDGMTAAEFRKLMTTVAAGWNEGNARKAADCFADDAIYSEPPRKQFYKGRAALFEFFGGASKPEPSMQMVWHHLVFDEATQVGSGEYTFQMNNRYHGVVMVKVTNGRISNWREYQYQSTLSWAEFVNENAF
jgi:SnoaL-like protein